jgi:hypothetical protein
LAVAAVIEGVSEHVSSKLGQDQNGACGRVKMLCVDSLQSDLILIAIQALDPVFGMVRRVSYCDEIRDGRDVRVFSGCYLSGEAAELGERAERLADAVKGVEDGVRVDEWQPVLVGVGQFASSPPARSAG